MVTAQMDTLKKIAKTMVLANLGLQWHVGYQKACIQADNFNGDLKKSIWTSPKTNQVKLESKV